MANVILRVKREDGSWAEIPALVGPEGPQGVSIDDIVLKSQEGGVSTYLILLSDGSEKTFQVTDGAIITDVSLISTDVLIDTYKISISDGSFFNFKVTNGRGIKSIAKTSTDVLSDTYTISYNDNTSSTFKVTNGRSITKIVKSNTDVLTDTYTISYNDNTTSTYTITNGRGIDYIEKDETIGISDRYTIHYNDGSTSYYHVVNGEAGPAGSIGNRIYLSGLVDKVNDEEGYGRVKELKESDFDLSKFTVVGSPLISENGMLVCTDYSNPSQRTNYVNTIPLETLANSSFEVECTFYPKNYTVNTGCMVYSLGINRTAGVQVDANLSGITFFCSPGTASSYQDQLNYKYKTNLLQYDVVKTWFEYRRNEGKYYFYASFDNRKKTLLGTQTPTVENHDLFNISYNPSQLIRIGAAYNQLDCVYPIDLKNFSITVDGKEVFSGNPTALDTIKANNYTVTGSPTITDDGTFKANATGDYLIKTGFTNEIKKELRCDGRFYYSTKTNNTGNIINLANGSVIYWTINSDGLITLYDGTNTSTVQIEIPLKDGDIFDTEIIYNASTVTLNVCLNEGVNYTTSIASQGLTTFNTWRLSLNENYWGGTIDLNTIHVYIDGNLVYQPCLKIPYTKAKTGSKIVDAAYRLRVEDCYNQYGAGNYYLFSSATEQFALPMPDIYGLIENLDTKIVNLDNKKVNRAGDTMTGALTIKGPSHPQLRLHRTNPAFDTPSENKFAQLLFLGSDDNWSGIVQNINNTGSVTVNGVATNYPINSTNLTSRTRNNDGSTYTQGDLFIATDSQGNAWTYGPHPANKLDNSNKLATTNWVRNHCCTTPATTKSTASLDAPCYVIENYVNGTSWYRIWSDGWIEQGGQVGVANGSGGTTIALIKNYSDANYCLQVTSIATSITWVQMADAHIVNKTNSSFRVIANLNNNSANWYTCGY